jgi:hypothetical protein
MGCGGLVGDGDEPDPEPEPEQPSKGKPDPECEIGVRRCSAEVREVCLQDGWAAIEACPSVERCDPTHFLPE